MSPDSRVPTLQCPRKNMLGEPCKCKFRSKVSPDFCVFHDSVAPRTNTGARMTKLRREVLRHPTLQCPRKNMLGEPCKCKFRSKVSPDFCVFHDPVAPRTNTGARMTKLRREVLRRMDRIAQGLPATEPKPPKKKAISRKLPWTKLLTEKDGRRRIKITCGCGQILVVRILMKRVNWNNEIFFRLVDPKKDFTYNSGLTQGRQNNRGTIENMPKEDFAKYLAETEAMRTPVSK